MKSVFDIAQKLLIILPCYLLIFNCSGIKGVKEYETGNIYNLGRATDYDVNQTIPRTLRKYQFQILDQYDTGGYYTIETDWKHRYPMQDEQEVGIIEGKTRLFIRIRKVSDSKSYVQLEVENMIRTTEDRTWFNSEPEPEMKEKIERIVDELKREFAESRLRR